MARQYPDRRQNLTESDKGLWFNQPSDSEPASASSLDISYQHIMGEIWSGQSLIDVEKIVSPSSFILYTFFVVASNATGYTNVSFVELDRSIKNNK